MERSSLLAKFKVIDGGGGSIPSLLDLPSIVLARSPFIRDNLIGLRVATTDARRALQLNRRQPAYNLWSAVLGQVPPQTGASLLTAHGKTAKLNGISTAHACFRGVRRPVGDDVSGFDTFAYVHKEKFAFQFSPSMSRCVELVEVPDDLVFVTYVKLDHSGGRPHGPKAFENGHIQGIVTHWSFVEADSNASDLPVDFETRYRKRMW